MTPNPPAKDVIYEAAFALSFRRYASQDPTFKPLYDSNKDYWNQTQTGVQLTLWCQLVDVHYGGREKFMDRLTDQAQQNAVKILYYARNAFVHHGWNISEYKRSRFDSQAKALEKFVSSGGCLPDVPDFSMEINNEFLIVKRADRVCHLLTHEAGP